MPTLSLTTHGLGLEGARQAAADLLQLGIAEKAANQESLSAFSEVLFCTLDLPDHALQGA